MVESQSADWLREPEVEVGALDGPGGDRKPALVGLHDGVGRNGQRQLVDGAVRPGEVRMGAGAVRADFVPDVRSLGSNGQPVAFEGIFDPKRKRERISRPRVEQVLHHDPVSAALRDVPGCPADEPVDRVSALGLVERQLLDPAVELVAAVRDPVRPRNQELAAARAAELVLAVAVEDGAAAARILPQTAADLDDDDALVAELELDLFARGFVPLVQERRPRHTMRANQNAPATLAAVL